MMVVYLLIFLALFSAVAVAAVYNDRRYGMYAERVNRVFFSVGLSSPLMFSIFPLGGGRDWTSWAGAMQVVAITAFMFHKLIFAPTKRSSISSNTESHTCSTECCRSCSPFGQSSQSLGNSNSNDGNYERIGNVDVAHWSSTQVAHWVEGLVIQDLTIEEAKRYADMFFRHRVDGSVLARMEEDQFKGLGIPFGHSLKISDAVVDLLASKDLCFGQDTTGDRMASDQQPLSQQQIQSAPVISRYTSDTAGDQTGAIELEMSQR
jgi:hypothetical protein